MQATKRLGSNIEAFSLGSIPACMKSIRKAPFNTFMDIRLRTLLINLSMYLITLNNSRRNFPYNLQTDTHSPANRPALLTFSYFPPGYFGISFPMPLLPFEKASLSGIINPFYRYYQSGGALSGLSSELMLTMPGLRASIV